MFEIKTETLIKIPQKMFNECLMHLKRLGTFLTNKNKKGLTFYMSAPILSKNLRMWPLIDITFVSKLQNKSE